MKVTRFSDKAPQEEVTLEFDFTKICTTISTSSVTVSQTTFQSTDNDTNDMLEGAPLVVGGKVYQLVKQGLDGNDYRFDCTVTSPGIQTQVFTLAGVLPVRRARE